MKHLCKIELIFFSSESFIEVRIVYLPIIYTLWFPSVHYQININAKNFFVNNDSDFYSDFYG